LALVSRNFDKWPTETRNPRASKWIAKSMCQQFSYINSYSDLVWRSKKRHTLR